MAERRIAEKTGRGVACFISNYSWLDRLSFTGMRERHLEAFDAVRIQVGTAIATLVRKPDHAPPGRGERFSSSLGAGQTRGTTGIAGGGSRRAIRRHRACCPFDNRWLYWEAETKLLDEKRRLQIACVRREYVGCARRELIPRMALR